jgi:iron(III) transport system substrate-binding protein
MLDTAGKKFTETHPGMTLRGQYLRAPELVQKLDAEAAAGKPVASIVMVPNPVTLYQWRDAGQLLEHHSPEEKAYPDWFKEPGWWIATRVLDIPLVYNTKLISEEPKGWDAMADPKLKGKLAFNDPGTVGGPTLLHYKLLKERFGPDFWPKVVQNEPKFLEQTGQVLDAVVNGEAAMGTMYGYDVLGALAQNSSAPLKPLWPPPTTVGFSANVIMKNSPNPDAARIAFDWLASKEGIETQISVHPMLTARDDVDLGPNRVKLSKLDWKPFDIKAFAAEENALKTEWKGVFKRQ